jgi:hypothetical protein
MVDSAVVEEQPMVAFGPAAPVPAPAAAICPFGWRWYWTRNQEASALA